MNLEIYFLECGFITMIFSCLYEQYICIIIIDEDKDNIFLIQWYIYNKANCSNYIIYKALNVLYRSPINVYPRLLLSALEELPPIPE